MITISERTRIEAASDRLNSDPLQPFDRRHKQVGERQPDGERHQDRAEEQKAQQQKRRDREPEDGRACDRHRTAPQGPRELVEGYLEASSPAIGPWSNVGRSVRPPIMRSSHLRLGRHTQPLTYGHAGRRRGVTRHTAQGKLDQGPIEVGFPSG